ncbi:MAG: ABC transporter ATP-binding protein [Planctomycetota bacterium]|nr:ABC transporter ATP-binding protein [Planctomycetota bacterium]
MKYYIRALKMALKYKWSLITAIFCSVMVAILWGANIGAVYPFVEVVFERNSLHDWVDGQVDESQLKIEELEGQIVRLQADGPLSSDAEKTLKIRQKQVVDYQSRISWLEYYGPTIKKWTPEKPFATLVLLVVVLLIGTVLKGAFLIGNMVLVARVGQRTVLDLQNAFFKNTLEQDLKTFGERGTGDLVGRIRGETGVIGNAITTLFGKTLREPFKMFACLLGAALINWRLLLFSMLVAPVAAFLMIRLSQSIKRANKRAVEQSAKLMNRLFQALTYVRIVKSHNMEAHERSQFRDTAGEVYRKSMKIAVYNSLFRMNNEVLGIGVVCISALAGGYLVMNQQTHLFGIQLAATEMSITAMLTFYAFLIAACDPIRKMADVYNILNSGLVACDRVFPLVDRVATIRSPEEPAPIPKNAASIRFESIQFGYDPEVPVLTGVDFEIRAGETIAIVGPNGCGKSTIVNFLLRFYDPDRGRILIDGEDIRNYDLQDLRRYVGMVNQQTMLFADSIANNIRYGTPEASELEVVDASKKAYADSFIREKMEKGYKTVIGEHGSTLSGGQRQRIALARAILRDSPVVVLDEATSQIDTESEVLIHRTLLDHLENRTAILITHRMSSIELADRVLVIDQGGVEDFGTHDELIGRNPLYQRLFNAELRESA